MNVQAFLKDLISLNSNSSLDKIIAQIGTDRFGGMTGSGILRVLNAGARNIADNELYLEIGTYRGLTICGAMAENLDKTFVAIDNFCQYKCENMVETLEENLKYIFDKIPENFRFKNEAIETVDMNEVVYDKKIGVCFFDGLHEKYWLLNAFRIIKKYLSDKAILIFDDAGQKGVGAEWVGEDSEAINVLLRDYKDNLKEIYFDRKKELSWHLDIRILEYSKG